MSSVAPRRGVAKCAACGHRLLAKEGATCSLSTCMKRYHLECLLLPEATQVSSDWRCPDCKRKVPKGDNTTTPVRDSNKMVGETSGVVPAVAEMVLKSSAEVARAGGESSKDTESPGTQLTLREEIQLFRAELREVRDELREFRREVIELNTSFGACTERVDSLEARIEVLEQKQLATPPDSKVGELELAVARLQLELNDREQQLLSSDLEIGNIPEIPGENVIHTVGLIAAKLGLKLEERDIVFAQRVGSRADLAAPTSAVVSPAGGAGAAGLARGTGVRGRRIVVRLARRVLRDQLLQNARVRRTLTTVDLGFAGPPRRFFLNERLTKSNKYLFYRVREAASRLGWRYTWTKFGRILAKQADGKPTHCIRSEDDLIRTFGDEAGSNRDKQ